jgi:hypothetical protein
VCDAYVEIDDRIFAAKAAVAYRGMNLVTAALLTSVDDWPAQVLRRPSMFGFRPPAWNDSAILAMTALAIGPSLSVAEAEPIEAHLEVMIPRQAITSENS